MTVWTKDMDSILKAGWQAGLSEPQIAAQVADVCGGQPFSRHSIQGRKRRLGLPERPAEFRRDALVFSNQSRRQASPPAPPKAAAHMSLFSEALPGSTPRPWLTRRFNECAWPVGGDRADTFSCCDPIEVTSRSPYCARHQALRQGEPWNGRKVRS